MIWYVLNGSVTDGGANWLLHCRKLRVLDLYQTEVSVPVYASLLMGLPELTAVGRCDKFGQVLGKKHDLGTLKYG